MKKLLFIFFTFLSVECFSQSAPIVNRSSSVVTVQDSRFKAQYNLYVPSYNDTTAANLQKSIDTSGAIIHTYNPDAFWYRQSFPKMWVMFASSTSGTYLDSVYVIPAVKTDSFYQAKNSDSTLVHIFDRNCGLISPGTVTYDSLLIYTVAPSIYILCTDGIRRTSVNTDKTLAPADATFDRRDAIILDATGVTVLTGIPSATPADPQINPNQIALTYITVPANATSIPPCSIVDVIPYDENTTWTVTGTATNNPNSTTVPYHLTKDIDVSAFTNGQTVILTTPTPITVRDFTSLKLFIRLKSTFNPNTSIQVSWVTSAGNATVNILDGTYGFNRKTIGSYQTITISISDFNAPNVGVAAQLSIPATVSLKFTLIGSNANGFYLDYIQLGGSCIVQPPVTGHDNSFGIVNTVSGNATATIPTDILTVTGTGGTTVSATGKTLTIHSTGGLARVYANNGLTALNDSTVQLGSTTDAGSPLLHDTYINTGATFALNVKGAKTSAAGILIVENTSLFGTAIRGISDIGIAVYGVSNGGYGVRGESTGGPGLSGQSSSASGVEGVSVTGYAGYFQLNPTASTNSDVAVLEVTRTVTGTAANGIGSYIEYSNPTTTDTRISNQLKSIWINATDATRTSQFSITGVNAATSGTILYINGGGAIGYTINTTSSGTNVLTANSASTQVFTGSSGTTWTLPAVSGNTGLTFVIKNRGSAAITLNSDTGSTIYTTSAVGTITINAGESYWVQNDGTYYLIF